MYVGISLSLSHSLSLFIYRSIDFNLFISWTYLYIYLFLFSVKTPWRNLLMLLDCDVVVNEFEPQSRYDVHFRANSPGKGMNLFILPTYC